MARVLLGVLLAFGIQHRPHAGGELGAPHGTHAGHLLAPSQVVYSRAAAARKIMRVVIHFPVGLRKSCPGAIHCQDRPGLVQDADMGGKCIDGGLGKLLGIAYGLFGEPAVGDVRTDAAVS